MNTCEDQLGNLDIMGSIRASLEDIEEDFIRSRSPDPSISFPAQTRVGTKLTMLRLLVGSFTKNITCYERDGEV